MVARVVHLPAPTEAPGGRPFATLSAAGDFDQDARGMLFSAVRTLLDQGGRRRRPIVLDMTGVRFIDAATVSELLHSHDLAARHGRVLRLRGVQGLPARLLTRTRTRSLLCEGDPKAEAAQRRRATVREAAELVRTSAELRRRAEGLLEQSRATVAALREAPG